MILSNPSQTADRLSLHDLRASFHHSFVPFHFLSVFYSPVHFPFSLSYIFCVFKAMKWSNSLSFSCSMGATRPASPSQHCNHQPRIARLLNRGLLVKSACFPTSSRLHPRVPSGCVFSYSTVELTPISIIS